MLQIAVEKWQYWKAITEQHELKFAEYEQLIPEERDIFWLQMTPLDGSQDETFNP